uniref:UL36 n=1 Tax=Steinernema glaseri TaxID=37863 RepID=A0A1I8A915_9BILA
MASDRISFPGLRNNPYDHGDDLGFMSYVTEVADAQFSNFVQRFNPQFDFLEANKWAAPAYVLRNSPTSYVRTPRRPPYPRPTVKSSESPPWRRPVNLDQSLTPPMKPFERRPPQFFQTSEGHTGDTTTDRSDGKLKKKKNKKRRGAATTPQPESSPLTQASGPQLDTPVGRRTLRITHPSGALRTPPSNEAPYKYRRFADHQRQHQHLL